MNNLDYKAISEKIGNTHDVKELSELRSQLLSCREAEQGAQNRSQEFTPEELNQALESTSNTQDLHNLREYAIQHRDAMISDLSESEGQGQSQSGVMGRGMKDTIDLDEKVKTKVLSR